ncbi:MAG: hypothetical protein LCI03_10890 [Actinobacteria bacterium]|jgi:xanthine/CO dehydrogenase XdhC/CoxF family maturation factor|nr:hypothetical protein [Actinomycetota bacterium]
MSDVEVSAAIKVRFAGAGPEAVDLAAQLAARGFEVQWSEVGEARAAFTATADRYVAIPGDEALDLLPWALGGRSVSSLGRPDPVQEHAGATAS